MVVGEVVHAQTSTLLIVGMVSKKTAKFPDASVFGSDGSREHLVLPIVVTSVSWQYPDALKRALPVTPECVYLKVSTAESAIGAKSAVRWLTEKYTGGDPATR